MLTSLPPDSELLRLQTNFTQHLRNPDSVPVPEGLDPRRMGIYSSLIFHNISSLVSDFFPVIRSLMTDDEWDSLVREFFITYQAETPYFPKLADEFLQFLLGREGANHTPDYLLPLAHYEWLELCLFLSESELPGSPVDPESLQSKRLELTDLAIPVAYDYPVHQIRSDWVENECPTYLLLFRDKTDSVRFFEIQSLAFELLTAMRDNNGVHVSDWLANKADELNQNVGSFSAFGMKLMQQFNSEHLISCADT